MVATDRRIDLPGGSFLMGNEEDAYPADGEGPVRSVHLSPFAISSTSVTTAEFATFVDVTGHRTIAELEGWSFVFAGHLPDDFDETRGVVGAEWWRQVFGADWRHPEGPQSDLADRGDHPVVHVSWFDAVAYAEWVGGRLPTEAEWEYASRAGRSTKWFFGDDPSKIGDYAWYKDNGGAKSPPVGQKKPNPWGLYDMHGNVAEWVLDGFTDGYRKGIADGTLNPWNIPITRYPRIVKGGSWDQDQDECRSGARLHSVNDWKDTDPQVPKSIWYHTDGQHIGFRIVRPLVEPSDDEKLRYWEADLDEVREIQARQRRGER